MIVVRSSSVLDSRVTDAGWSMVCFIRSMIDSCHTLSESHVSIVEFGSSLIVIPGSSSLGKTLLIAFGR